MTTLEALRKHDKINIYSTDYARRHDIAHYRILNYIMSLIKQNDVNSKYFIYHEYGAVDEPRIRFLITEKGVEHLDSYYKIEKKKIFNARDIF